jgi:exodeoxyribonuclease V beta subunit
MPDPEAASSPLAQLLHARSEADSTKVIECAAARLADGGAARGDLRALAAESQGTVAVAPLEPEALPPAHPAEPRRLADPRPLPTVPERAVSLSFTSLSGVKRSVRLETEERDVDSGAAARPEGGVAPVTDMDGALQQVGVQGAALGTLVHDALAERAAFECLAPGSAVAPLEQALRRHAEGLALERGEVVLPALAAALQRALAAPTGVPEIESVAEAARDASRCLRELKLSLPWQAAPARLAQAMRVESTPWSERVARALEQGESEERIGSLVGSIDLAVERDGRWFIYDYKTNFLGHDPAAYEGEGLHRAMASELYPLQAALYSVMLTRWLKARGWSAAGGAPAIGGVAYLFLRGMDPAAGARGTWTWKPSQASIDALDRVLPRVQVEVGS